MCIEEEESLTSSSCNDRFDGEIAVHLRWKNFMKACFFPTISNRWGRIALYLGRDYTHFNIRKLITVHFQMGQLGTYEKICNIWGMAYMLM